MSLPIDETAERCPDCGERIPPEAALCPGCRLQLYEVDLTERFRRPVRVKEGEFTETRPVYAGTLSEVMAVRAALATRGFETFIQDDWMKVMNPFLTGGFCLGATLRAAEDRVEAIARAIAQDRAGTGDDDAEDELEQRFEGLQDLGSRIGWCAISGVLAPVGLIFTWLYVGELRRLKRLPPGIVFAFFASVLCLYQTLNWIGYYFLFSR